MKNRRCSKKLKFSHRAIFVYRDQIIERDLNRQNMAKFSVIFDIFKHFHNCNLKKSFLKLIIHLLERTCVLFHWLNLLLVRMGKPHCPLTLLSWWLDKKYNVGVYKNLEE